jgi:CRISP-associated protein Cas1
VQRWTDYAAQVQDQHKGTLYCPARDPAIKKLRSELNELDKRPPQSIQGLLGIEGRAAFAYLNSWQSLPLRWRGTARHPIPDEWHRIGQRQSFARKKPKNSNASHPVNAILNYAYAVLESRVRIHVVAAGYDPAIGLLHSGRMGRGRHGFVLDLMEPPRPIVDRQVLKFVQAHTFHPTDFTIRTDGVCRLNPEMAKLVAQQVDAKIVASGRHSLRNVNDRNNKKIRDEILSYRLMCEVCVNSAQRNGPR